MLKKIIFAFIWICLLSYTILSADTLIKLKGNSLIYDEELEQLIASGNASLNHPDFSVFAKKLVVNTQLNTVDGVGDILIKRDGEQLISDYFHLNLDSKEMQFDKLSLTVDGSNGKLYIHASSFNETEAEKHGLNGHLTTCDLKTPHYAIKTRSFLLNPGERFIGKHVIIEQALVTIPLFYGKSLTLYVSPTLFFPFWMPSYIYELGKRKVVYLFPKFGTNTTEGFWFKSQFDYYNSESNWGSIYVDYMSTFGVGLGGRHHYKAYAKGDGSAFSKSDSNDTNYVEYYSILNTPFENIKWKNTQELSKNIELTHFIETYKRPTGRTSFTKMDKQRLNLIYDKVGDKKSRYQSININHTRPLSSDSLSTTFKDVYQGNEQWKINGNQNKLSNNLENYYLDVNQSHKVNFLIGEFDVKHNVKLSGDERLINIPNEDSEVQLDQKLNVNQSITKTFDGTLQSIRSDIDLEFDPDGNEFQNPNIEDTWVKKLPNLTFTFKQRNPDIGFGKLTFQESLQSGHIIESSVVTGIDDPVETTAQRYVLTEVINLKFSELPGITGLNFNSTYKQFLFSTGDQAFKLNFGASITTDWFSFLQTNTSYSRSYVPEESNSPFQSFEVGETTAQSTETVSEKITLYVDSPSKYKTSFNTSYDLQNKRKSDLSIDFLIKPDETFSLTGNTKFFWSESNSTTIKDTYSFLSGQLNIKPNSNIELLNPYKYDLNNGHLQEITNTIRYNLKHATSLTHWSLSWLNDWSVDLNFNYTRDVNEHQLKSLTLKRNMHCRSFVISWNIIADEYSFGYSINAFPNDTINFKTDETGKTDFKIKGVTNDNKTESRY